MKRRYIYIVLIAIFTCIEAVSADENVGAMWTSLTVKKTFEKGFSLSAYGEYRCKDNFTATDLWFLRLTTAYKPCPYVQLGLAYDFCNIEQPSAVKEHLLVNPWTKRQHRLLADVVGMYKYQNWSFSLRERYVMAYAMSASVAAADTLTGLYAEWDSPAGVAHVMRSCPTISYAIPKSRFSPYVSLELYNSLQPSEKFALQQAHLFVGTDIRLTDVSSMKLFYLFNAKVPAHKYLHTLGVYYTVSL